MAAKEREEINGMAKQKMARQRSKEGANHLEQKSIRIQWKALMEGNIMQWMDKA